MARGLPRQWVRANVELHQIAPFGGPSFDTPGGVNPVRRIDAFSVPTRIGIVDPAVKPRLWKPLGYRNRITTQLPVLGFKSSRESEPEPFAIGVFESKPNVSN